MTEPTQYAFQQTQHQLARHLRDPDNQSALDGIEDRRLQIYRDLIFNNIESFISSGFPVLRSLYNDENWVALVRSFIVKHQCHSPYFLEISQEFLHFLQDNFTSPPSDMPFLLELCHYEWVELALSVATEQVSEPVLIAPEQVLETQWSVSPLAWRLSYQYPVHCIGPKNQPLEPPEQPVFLVVYRNVDEQVKFMEVNAVTFRLLQLIEEFGSLSGEQVIKFIAKELNTPAENIEDFAVDLLKRFSELGIIFP